MLPTRPRDQFISVSGLRLHYLDWGTEGKRPYLMLHGIARTAHTFDHIAPHFNSDYHVIAADLQGHGDSDWHPEGAYLVEDYVKSIEEMVEQLELQDMVVAGNSTGGRVAQVYAGLHPDRVSKLIVEDVGPERPTEIAAGFTRRVQEEADGWASEDELVQYLLAGSPRVSEALHRSYVRYGTLQRDDGRLVWKRDPDLAKGFIPTQLWQHVRRIACPTLYVLGGESSIVPLKTQQQLKRTIPDCEIIVMPGVGHYPHLEAPEDYIAIVKGFLAKRTRY